LLPNTPRQLLLYHHWFYKEQFLLQASLTFDDTIQVLWAGDYMHSNHPGALKRAFSSDDPFFLRNTKGVLWLP
jgi:hypothetical protein